MRRLRVHIDHRHIGELAEGESLWSFRYDAAWSNAPDAFDLSPALPRSQLEHTDGASLRPVQWYFDNLLPEEGMRETLEKEAGIAGHDAFALLAWLGAESAGSLTLLPPDKAPPAAGDSRPLGDEDLTRRIRNLPRASLTQGAAKRMSAAGAQHKLLVLYDEASDVLAEPVGATPSTHILKPDHPDVDSYAHSVVNEYFTMRLARAVGLDVPDVWRHHTPLPVYLVRRFDRIAQGEGPARRRHIIDACQLLGRSYLFKYQAGVEEMQQIAQLCRQKAVTRQRLFRWLLFNALVGNHDNHLKNLSFTIGPAGIDLAPHYDLVSTGVYHTRAFADASANWPYPQLAVTLAGANSFHTVTREAMVNTGRALGLGAANVQRDIDGMTAKIAPAAEALIEEIAAQNATLPAPAQAGAAGEMRLLRAISRIVIREMTQRLAPA